MQANILHVKHGWDVSILYSRKHARGDTVQGYGTPGIGAKFIGKEKDNVSEAGRAAWNLFAKFADSKFFFVTLHVTLGVDLIPLVGRNEETTKGFSVEASSWQKSPGYEDEFVAPCSSFIISLVLFFSLNWNRLQ